MLIPTQCPQRFLQFAPPSNEHLVRCRVPLDWAMTQNNLGNALVALGERESGTARFEGAVSAYREALKEYTRVRVPLDWAMTQNNLGNALPRSDPYSTSFTITGQRRAR
jgi:hypothetical protein